MTFTQIEEILEKCKKIHRDSKNQVDFSKEDEKLAFYLLQGAAITVTTSALEFNQRGFMGPLLQQTRMLSEIINLIAFFEELPQGSEFLREWFQGKLYKRKFMENEVMSFAERAKKHHVSEEYLKMIDEKTKEANDILSKYSHPSMEIVRANSSRTNHEFDYEHRGTSDQGMNPQLFAEKHIVHCINSILIPNRFLHVPDEEYTILRKCSLIIQGR